MITRRNFLALGFAPILGSAYASNAIAEGRWPRPAPIPPGYQHVAKIKRVPAAVLYAVALQESQMRFGKNALPYPWTLNIQGVPKRFDSYRAAVAALVECLRMGILLVDIGLLQICWLYHHIKLRNPARALDPYPNMEVGAELLQNHFKKTGNWFRAVANYHNADPAIGDPYATSVFRHLGRIPSNWGER